MTNQEAIKMLTAKVECIRRETSGTDIDCNLRNCDDCELCYAQGTTGEQRKALNMAISALQAQEELYVDSKCKTCRYYHDHDDVRCMICDDENDMYEEKEAKHSTESSSPQKALNTISRARAIEMIESTTWYDPRDTDVAHEVIGMLPPEQPEPEWGLPVSINRPLSDQEIIPRLREIQRQIGGSYAIDRAIELIKALAERRTDDNRNG